MKTDMPFYGVKSKPRDTIMREVVSDLEVTDREQYEQLVRYALALAHEDEFFIRKAVGWALREHAKTDPHAVVEFLEAHRHRLSGLTIREASKHLDDFDV